KADHFHLGGYMGYRHGVFAFKAGLSHSEHRSDSRRYVSILGFQDTLTARPHERTTQVFTEMAYDMDMPGFTLTPFVRGAYVHLDAPGFTEHGHDAALKIQDSHQDEVSSLAGVRFVKQLMTKQ